MTREYSVVKFVIDEQEIQQRLARRSKFARFNVVLEPVHDMVDDDDEEFGREVCQGRRVLLATDNGDHVRAVSRIPGDGRPLPVPNREDEGLFSVVVADARNGRVDGERAHSVWVALSADQTSTRRDGARGLETAPSCDQPARRTRDHGRQHGHRTAYTPQMDLTP